MSETINNVTKINDEVYKYDSVKTNTIQISKMGLIAEKEALEKRLVDINYLLSEIEKLKVF